MTMRSQYANDGFVGKLRSASDENRESIWSRRTSADSKDLWKIPCPERWDLLPPSERNVRSKCCAALCFLGEIRLWENARPRGAIADAKICGECKKPLYGLRIIQNMPEFTADLHREILAHFSDALAVGVEVQQDGSWALAGKPRIFHIAGVARQVLAEIVKASNANQPDAPEFP